MDKEGGRWMLIFLEPLYPMFLFAFGSLAFFVPNFAKPNLPTPVFPVVPQEFEIELEGSQTLRLLCYEKCYNKTKQNKEDGESTDRIMGKGQIPV